MATLPQGLSSLITWKREVGQTMEKKKEAFSRCTTTHNESPPITWRGEGGEGGRGEGTLVKEEEEEQEEQEEEEEEEQEE